MRKIILYDISHELCEAWKKYFADVEEVEIRECSFEDLHADYVVTSGNSFGMMYKGLDLVVRNYYGIEIQDLIQAEILNTSYTTQLLVGESLCIDTMKPDKRFLIYAATSMFPEATKPLTVFYIFANLLSKYKTFACPGLCTVTGQVSVEDCARNMRLAWDYINSEELIKINNIEQPEIQAVEEEVVEQ